MNEKNLWFNALIFAFCRHTCVEKKRCGFQLKRMKKEKRSAVGWPKAKNQPQLPKLPSKYGDRGKLSQVKGS